MSKRQREEANIESIRAILGDIPVKTIEDLLHRSNQNVETAVNLYFSDPLPIIPTQTSKNTSKPKLEKPKGEIKYYIGDLVITGWSLLKGPSPVKEGSVISIMRDKVNNYSNKIVRFGSGGKELGRLPKEVADYIAALIDFNLCKFEGTLVWCPPQLKIGEDMIILLKCYMLPAAMHTNTFMSSVIPKAKRGFNNRSVEEPSTLRKIALLQIFKSLGLRPARSSIQRMNVGSDDTWDLLLQNVETKAEEPEEDETNEFDEEEKKEVSDDTLDHIYEKAQVFDSHIQPMEQPDTMALELKEYQKRALAWMTAKESTDAYDDGDIDMRAIHPLWEEYEFPAECEGDNRFFYFNPYSGELSLEFPEASSQEKGGILADGSKPGTITVEVFYGDERSHSTIEKMCQWNGSAPDVLLTTYGVVMGDWSKVQTNSSHASPLFGVEFWRVVLDEAHQIKNKTTKTSLACRDIKSKRRWAVTGTPIQNKLDDLYSLVRFLRHEPWANHTFWRTFISIPFEKQDPRALTAVQSVLEPIVLRRTKAMRDRKGRPMVPLPPKTIHIEYLTFSPEEQDIYDAIYNDSQIKFSYFCQAGKVGVNYASIFQLLTRLRQICCHPYLALKSKGDDEEVKSEGGKGIRLEDLIAKHNTSKALTNQDIPSEHGTYGLNVLQNMLALQKGSSQSDMETQHSSPMDALSTMTEECPICFETPETMIALPCMHMACRICVMDYFQKKENEGAAGECPICRQGPILQSDLLEIGQKSNGTETPDSQKGKNVKFDIRKAVGGFRLSTKMNALISHLRQNERDNCKTVVFSQFTSFLDLIGEALDYECIHFTRLDGTQSQAQREKVLSSFSKAEEGSASVLLISLRAGGVGLNLTCANRVVMMDPWWNFSIEAQAIDRVHRLGQLKDVTVTRFVMRDTVEERILTIQNRKHVLVNELYQSRDHAKNRKMDDLQLLFSKSGAL
ncbi:P-loop containing nucleoside triphosphate hydrolase protein [Mucor mucedo]|uniref:P-loop containing nucleoside triphosphate hydrolase protein n=1 Tax=Mucor mucedo TaxID=29922 RepID=UPI00221ED727|nr:P-loop containing nucleoside triphosphate hydrolase protein [Mucor mucedo]KAI7887816.1 P-loop containing nucleoside triphosphate hydrolase protein [Mucor mucedo]